MEGLESDFHVNEIRLEHVSGFKYLRCVLDESGTDGAECSRKVVSGRRMYLFLCIAARQCYRGRRRNLELGLYRRTTSEVCLVLGKWIESRMCG